MNSKPACLFLFALLIVASGCEVRDKVVWFPDSSGFIFTTGNGVSSIRLYDARKNQSRTIIEDSRANTPVPAVSPDGKSLAVVRIETRTGQKTAQLFVYSLEGVRTHASKNYLWKKYAGLSASRLLVPSAVAWSRDGNHILIWEGATTGFYDLESENLFILDGLTVFNGSDRLSPIRPDGKGFLANKKDSLVFHEWNGREVTIQNDVLHQTGTKEKGTIIGCAWDDQTVSLAMTNGTMEIFTNTGRCKWTPSEPTSSDGRLRERFAFDDGKTEIRVRTTGKDKGKEKNGVIELRSQGSTTVLVEGIPVDNITLSPSPAGDLVDVAWKDASNSRIHAVFDSAGRRRGHFYPDMPFSPVITKGEPGRSPGAYAIVAGHLGDEVYHQRKGKAQQDDTQAIAEANAVWLDLSEVESGDRTIAFVAAEGREAIRAMVESMRRTALLPKPPGDSEQIAEGFVLGLFGQLERGFQQQGKYQEQAEALLAEARRVSTEFQRLNAAKLLLPRIARKYGGPKVEAGHAVHILDFNGRWGCFTRYDQVWLKNNTPAGTILHNVTLLVEIVNKKGEVAKNVHFLPEWKSREVLQGNYLPGRDFGAGKFVCRQTVDAATTIRVSIWCDELSQENVVRVYSANDWEDDIRRYCKLLNPQKIYRPFTEGILWNNQRGVKVKFQGHTYLPPCQVHVTFSRGEGKSVETITRYWEIDSWSEGEEKIFASEAFKWHPDSVYGSIRFNDTNVSVGF
ncbi:hypothetical protein OAF34_02775 [Pirellulaceae bacterium]|nr:hypothetical protein [Pirellulaceae bacterium]